jgi:hypothetical protein
LDASSTFNEVELPQKAASLTSIFLRTFIGRRCAVISYTHAPGEAAVTIDAAPSIMPTIFIDDAEVSWRSDFTSDLANS